MPPAYVFVNGNSLGAHTGAAAVQARPDVFDGAVLQCGGIAGAIGLWNSKLDALYVAKTLLAPGDPRYPIIDIPDNFATVTRPDWLAMLQQAQQTPQGKARIALAAVIAQLPTWSVGSRPIPAPGNYEALQVGLYDSLAGGGLPVVGQAMSSRNEINRRSGGNISWNLGVDYAAILASVANSGRRACDVRQRGTEPRGGPRAAPDGRADRRRSRRHPLGPHSDDRSPARSSRDHPERHRRPDFARGRAAGLRVRCGISQPAPDLHCRPPVTADSTAGKLSQPSKHCRRARPRGSGPTPAPRP